MQNYNHYISNETHPILRSSVDQHGKTVQNNPRNVIFLYMSRLFLKQHVEPTLITSSESSLCLSITICEKVNARYLALLVVENVSIDSLVV